MKRSDSQHPKNPSQGGQLRPPPQEMVNAMANLVPSQMRQKDMSMMCLKHNSRYQNYCESDHEPLCNGCISEHNHLHFKIIDTNPMIVTIDEAMNLAKNKMALLRDNVEGQLEIVSTEDILSHLEDMVQRVIIAKKEMITEINKIAESMLKDIELIQTKYRKIQLKKPFIEAAEVINKHIENLKGHRKVQEIQYCYLFDEANFKAQFNATVRRNKADLEKSKCEINYDKVQFRKLVTDCFKIIIPTYGHVNEEDDQPKDEKVAKTMGGKMFESFVNNLNKAVEEENNLKMQRLNELVQKDTNKNISLKPEQERKIEEQNIAKRQFQEKILKVEDDQKGGPSLNIPSQIMEKLPVNPEHELRYVHYFEINSYNLHLYNLVEGIFEVRRLKLPERIPFYHKSVQTSDSVLFLSGGRTNTGKTGRRNTSLISYNIMKDTFKIHMNNLKPRSSHSLVEHKSHLYILGGFSETNFERVIERIDLPHAKAICYRNPSQFGGECISASVGDFIWKISTDGLELYNPKGDEWKFVVINDFTYFESCLCAAINYDQVFVFGGYDNGERGVKNSHVIRQTRVIETLGEIDEYTFVIEKRDQHKLIDGEGFSDNNLAMNKDNLYVYSNTSNQHNEIVTDVKNLVTFDGTKWKYVPNQKDTIYK